MGLHITQQQYKNILNLINEVKDGIEVEARIAKAIDPYAFQRLLSYLGSNVKLENIYKHPDTLDISSKELNNARLTIIGIEDITEYCKAGFTTSVKGINKTRIGTENIAQHNIGIKSSIESPFDDSHNKLLTMQQVKKLFRMKKRTSFNMNANFRVDCTMVRSKEALRLSSAFLNNTPIIYEVEVEYIGGATTNGEAIVREMLSIVAEVLKVVDDCEYLMPIPKTHEIIEEYCSVAFPQSEFKLTRVLSYPKSVFIGPQPISMELRNLQDATYAHDSVLVNYTVTHKADGERNLVFIDKNGHVYLINNRMSLKPTKIHCPSMASSIFDAEVINFKEQALREIHIFDAYFVNKNCIADLPLESDAEEIRTRMSYARQFVTAASRSQDKHHTIKVKKFLLIHNSNDFYAKSDKLLKEQESKMLEFNTDGLIYTPMLAPVGAIHGSQKYKLGGTWMSTLKWKPAEDNTIDFLVRTRKLPGQQHDEIVQNHLKTGLCKVLDLYVGATISDTTAWEYCNNLKQRKGYMPVPFNPSNVDEHITVSSTNVAVDNDGFLRCDNGDIIIDDSIVEMAWNPTQKGWKPLRVRVDKTELYRSTKSISGTANNEEVADRVWSSIVFPVTSDHITGKIKVKPSMVPIDASKYYANNTLVERDKTLTIDMQNFHNLWIKNATLISKFKGKCKSLVDLGCGKGGDLNKWIDAGFTTVMGLDLFADNLNNQHNGLYKRLTNVENRKNSEYSRKTHKYLFVPYDVSTKLTKESIEEVQNDHERALLEIAFGYKKAKVTSSLRYLENLAHNRFDVVSSQFAIHYLFKNDTTLSNYLYNVDKLLKTGGYFIGTCFDGRAIANALEAQDTISGEKQGKVIWTIKRKFNLPYNQNQTGQAINVFMDTINQSIDEYLVDYNHLKNELSKYNIHPLTDEECEELGVSSSTAMFSESFDEMKRYVIDNKKKLTEREKWMNDVVTRMSQSPSEKQFSFLNRWFIFKKKKQN